MPRFDTAALDDIPEGSPHKAMAGDTPILLIRRGDEVTALAHACPHLGLPLSKGVVRGDTIICAFHHACFDARTGRQTQPPGHGDLRRYDVTVTDGRVSVDVPEDADPHVIPDHAAKGLDPRRILIAGSGAAGEACALTLREEGFEGSIAMISPETRAPYDRTMLSKAVLAGGKTVDELTTTDAAGLATRDITRIAARVTAVTEGRVTLADGGTHAFDALLLAPGGIANVPDLPGTDLAGVHTLRSAEEAARIADAAGQAKKAVLIGGGFIGLEAALSLSKRGLDVTVAMREDVPLARILGEKVGRTIMAEHEDAGVIFIPGAEIECVKGDAKVTGVALADGTVIDADLVLLAIGVRPATVDIDGIATGKGGGVETASDLSIPGRPGVHVAGDCARAPTPFGPARIEHWRVARQHGIRAARAMLGRAGPTDDIPFFWTALARQYRYVGHAEDWDDIMFDGDPSGPFLARYVKDGMVMAALTAGRDADLADLHLAMAEAGGPIPA
ncbi:FAD-dependent oxidoreductase [Jannaschia sp. S6380]|uniref:FAD-dependent oxidoreductase n=1 Tax=Jannaschia sp. S6380 TaxID=2926408 RepID=UPI001FF14BD1|nr:FAD-dependent oxidoreductase [Jannaschia sp. S6380]MCK0168630.1 FAD-dependent oxidoreductase [Jannaschia sp. S6380]